MEKQAGRQFTRQESLKAGQGNEESTARAGDGEGQTGAMELLYMAEARVRPETRRRTPDDENYENECQQESEAAL
ncbi:hypothetical protein CEP54_007752 [Fusarium duplospermum]|uniref:Uncharacterized protein n=1 Tax=Fusarium duplospermum TaxID=1325734 RepID=A0A428PZM9_9HYPO|nr:hypothetical protein CEP54_007752 [Fusarium duplospermum]